jgi:Ca2+-binding EF-hand superfamily protein
MLGQQQRWDAFFHLYDVNGDGVLSEADALALYSRGLAARGMDLNSPEAARILENARIGFAARIAGMDGDGDGKVTLDEWRASFEKNRNNGFFPSAQMMQGNMANFQAFDFDGDGRITLGDYQKLAALIGRTIPEAELSQHFKLLCEYFGTGDGFAIHEYLAATIHMVCSPAAAPFWLPSAA